MSLALLSLYLLEFAATVLSNANSAHRAVGGFSMAIFGSDGSASRLGGVTDCTGYLQRRCAVA